MVEAVAYIALAISLISMSMKEMLYLRFFHITSSFLYGIYAFFISSIPLMVSASLFIVIHAYKLYQAKNERTPKEKVKA